MDPAAAGDVGSHLCLALLVAKMQEGREKYRPI